MRKKITMLLASLFACVGVMKAQPKVGTEYRIKDDKTAKYLTIASYNANSGGAKGTVPVLEKEVANADQVWTLEETGNAGTYYLKSKSGYYLKCRGWNVDALNDGDKSPVSLETPTVDYLAGLTIAGYAEGTSFCIKNGDKYFKTEEVGGTVHPFCNATPSDGWANRTTWTFEEVPADEFAAEVELTLVYNFGDKKVSEEVVEKIPGSTFTLAIPTFTKIASCKVGDEAQTVTDGACSIVVPNAAATITVELENNLPFAVSESFETATWYVLQIRGSQNVVNQGNSVSSKAPTTAANGSLWAFMGNPYDGIQVLNKAAGAGKTLALDGTAKMKDGATSWEILKNGNGFILRVKESENNCLNDVNGTLSNWNSSFSLTDAGSTFTVVSEEQMVSLATTAMQLASKLDDYAEASYYTYPNAAVAEAKATLQGVATPTDFLTALNAKAKAEAAQKILTDAGKSGAPAVGDIIQLKNRRYGNYLIANEDVAYVGNDKNDESTLWIVEEGEGDKVKLKNYSTNEYIGKITLWEPTPMEEVVENTHNLVFKNQTDLYAVLQDAEQDYYPGYAYASWNGNDKIEGWDPTSTESQWIVSNVRPLSVVFKFNGETLESKTISGYAEQGEKYTVVSPYDFTVVGSCTVNGEALEAVEGVYSFVVDGAAEVVVEIEENLPFKTATITDGQFAANTEWYVIKHREGNNIWLYDAADATANVSVKSQAFDIYNADHLWCFTGNVVDGFKIHNKAVAASFSLSNEEPAVLVDGNETTWDIEVATEAFGANDNRLAFKYREKVNSYEVNYANLQGGKLKGWWDRDLGSVSCLISVSAEIEKVVAAWSEWFNVEGIVGSIKDTDELQTLIDAYLAAPSQATEDAVEEYIANAEKVALTAGYYFIKATGVGNNASWYASYGNNNSDFMAVATETPGAKHLWSFEAVEGEDGYKLQACNLGKYAQLANASSNGGQASSIAADYENGYKFVFEDKGVAKFTVKDGNGNVMRTEGSGAINYWAGETNETWYFIPVTELEISINDFASICLPFDVEVEGAQAYAVTGTTATAAILTAKADIPAGQGAILEGDGVATLKFTTAESDWTANMLKGSFVNTYVEGSAYVLATNGGETVGLYKAKLNRTEAGEKVEEGGTHFLNNANKAYLPAPVAEGAAPAMFVLSRGGEDEDATGIDQLINNGEVVIYDLSGRRVQKMEKGIYIVNGKKVVK